MPVADALAGLLRAGLPLRLTAYDGSAAGPPDAPYRLRPAHRAGLAYLLTAPGDLGFARAYVSGDLVVEGVHPGDPYDLLVLLLNQLRFRAPSPAEAVALVRSVGLDSSARRPRRRRRRRRAGAACSRACATR